MKIVVERSSIEAAGSVLALVCAALTMFASAATFFAFPLLLWGIGTSGANGVWAAAWLFAVVAVLLLNIVRAATIMREPHLKRLAAPLLASSLVLISCPLWRDA